jgi:hypothetical protein
MHLKTARLALSIDPAQNSASARLCAQPDRSAPRWRHR